MMNVYKQNLKEKLIRYYKPVLYILGVLIVIGIYAYFGLRAYAVSTSQAISDQVIRFHVLANSDTTYDQILKEEVRDAVLSYMEPNLKYAKDINESREIIEANRSEIEEVARGVMDRWGVDYDVEVQLTSVKFPTKAYGDVVFPAGEYEACQIKIGEAKGQNWWCVMYPPLCYVDAATGTLPEEGKQELSQNLTQEQYNIVANQNERPYQVKFKILEWFGR